eukprot:PLAT6844.2.p1 GENE.PLAT6844.2~~PLAT6844.2.p1  ORF type:complete len:172 (-),score=42.67 PLAT6844.2:40-555(-)
MKIFIRKPTGKRISVEMEADEPISLMKERIQDKEGVPPEYQRLSCGDKLMLDDTLIAGYGLADMDTVDIAFMLPGALEDGKEAGGDAAAPPDDDAIDFFIRTESGRSLAITASPADTLLSLKKQLSDMEGIAADTITLSLRGRALTGDVTQLRELGIVKEVTLRMVLDADK